MLPNTLKKNEMKNIFDKQVDKFLSIIFNN